jgi:hypothetical protein
MRKERLLLISGFRKELLTRINGGRVLELSYIQYLILYRLEERV